MTINFCNPGDLDLDVIRLMGVSVKTNNNPIGFFGTGLKFAIATLLRTGHQITLTTGGERYELTEKPVMVRGKEFRVVHMNEEKLGFTTELGKNWEVWQAYRELHSNTLDEKGEVLDSREFKDKSGLYDTVMSVTGDGIEKAYATRRTIFISTTPLASNGELEIHPGPSQAIYYRGVMAARVPSNKFTAFTYNILAPMTLTEDRTLAEMWRVEYAVENNLPALSDTRIADGIMEGVEKWDQGFNFEYCHNPTEAFIKRAMRAMRHAEANPSLRKVVDKTIKNKGEYEPCKLREAEQSILNKAMEFLRSRLDVEIARDDVIVTDTLGPETFGLYDSKIGKIVLTRWALDNGDTFVATTLYEEWVHKTHGLKDCTRNMQQFLFDRLITVAGRN